MGDNDWDRNTIKAPSVYLKLANKGDEVRIRIADRPYREPQLWPREKGGRPVPKEETARFTPGQWKRAYTSAEWNPSEVFHLVVIDRADGAAKILAVFASTYTKIQEYAKNPDWGNPTNYDIIIKRTEEPGKNYFSVMPLPTKTSLTESEKAKVAALDMAKLIQGALPAADPQPDDFSDDTVTEALPWENWEQDAPKTPELATQPNTALEDSWRPPEHPDPIHNPSDNDLNNFSEADIPF